MTLQGFIEGIFKRGELARKPDNMHAGAVARYLVLLDAALHLTRMQRSAELVPPTFTLTLFADKDPSAIVAFRIWADTKKLPTEVSVAGTTRTVHAFVGDRIVAGLTWLQWGKAS